MWTGGEGGGADGWRVGGWRGPGEGMQDELDNLQ